MENREKLCQFTEKSAYFMREIDQEAAKSELGIFDLWKNNSTEFDDKI
ncbi:MAG: hypothetical protein J4F36_12695 [Nitrosopumilaceae archaeon]|nr:hypothetical protein [Nitrosopumilaceae archaeon]